MSDQKKWTGGCLCGFTRYEASGTTLGSFVCHCRMCQRASGSAFAALFYVTEKNVRLTKGSVKTYESSPGVNRDFCGECGSALFFRRENRPGQCAIMVGSPDTPDDFTPDVRMFLANTVSWLKDLDRTTGYAEKPQVMTPPLNYNPVTGKIDG